MLAFIELLTMEHSGGWSKIPNFLLNYFVDSSGKLCYEIKNINGSSTVLVEPTRPGGDYKAKLLIYIKFTRFPGCLAG